MPIKEKIEDQDTRMGVITDVKQAEQRSEVMP